MTDYQEVDGTTIIIPVCCREGHDDCKHVIGKVKKKRRNIAV